MESLAVTLISQQAYGYSFKATDSLESLKQILKPQWALTPVSINQKSM